MVSFPKQGKRERLREKGARLNFCWGNGERFPKIDVKETVFPFFGERVACLFSESGKA